MGPPFFIKTPQLCRVFVSFRSFLHLFLVVFCHLCLFVVVSASFWSLLICLCSCCSLLTVLWGLFINPSMGAAISPLVFSHASSQPSPAATITFAARRHQLTSLPVADQSSVRQRIRPPRLPRHAGTYGRHRWSPARSPLCSCRTETFGKRGSFYACHWQTAEEEEEEEGWWNKKRGGRRGDEGVWCWLGQNEKSVTGWWTLQPNENKTNI